MSVQAVHLVGSVGLDNAERVFRLACDKLGPLLRRLPDGETGERRYWISWQRAVLAACPALVPDPLDATPNAYGEPNLALRDGARGADCTFGPLGYAAAAASSFELFSALKRAGVIPAATRFQVSLPTPLAPLTVFLARRDQAAVEPPYEWSLLREVDAMCAAIPHDQLAIQWDVCVELCVQTGFYRTFLRDPLADMIARLVRLGDYVPRGVELGYHFCHGDSAAVPQANDTALMVQMANCILRDVGRPIHWMHFPVTRRRGDDGTYYEALGALRPHEETDIFLGLLHEHDGVAGARHRIALARRALGVFGVAAPCGLGRRRPDEVAAALDLHRAVAS